MGVPDPDDEYARLREVSGFTRIGPEARKPQGATGKPMAEIEPVPGHRLVTRS